MINFIQHSEEINKDYASSYFALYSKGVWGMDVGYTPRPLWYVNWRKRLCDYQELCSVDCSNEFLTASQGSITVNCCPPGSTRVETSNQTNCCPPGYTYNSSFGKCTMGTLSSAIPTIPCPCCPPGYTYLSFTGVCQGVKASDTTEPIDCLPRCLDVAGVYGPLIACPDRVPDSIVLESAAMNTSGCTTSVIRPWDGNC